MIADLVAQTFTDAGLGLKTDGTLLDFGCSSCRVLRVLAACRRDVESIVCDPNSGAIAWASENLPMARFFSNATTPPLQAECLDHPSAVRHHRLVPSFADRAEAEFGLSAARASGHPAGCAAVGLVTVVSTWRTWVTALTNDHRGLQHTASRPRLQTGA